MLVFMQRSCTRGDVDCVLGVVRGLGRQARSVVTDAASAPGGLPGVEVLPIEHSVERPLRRGRPDARVPVGKHVVGAGSP